MTKRLLVVGAGAMRAAAFATWQRMGLDVVLVDGVSTARYEDLADEFWALDPRDGTAPLDRILSVARRCDGVTTLADDSQLTVARIAEALGRPGIGGPAAAAARSKARQRELSERAGLPTPRWCAVRGPEDLHAFYRGGASPAVLKPVDATGGAGVLRVESLPDALRQWPVVRSLSRSRTAVVEELVDGPEVCVEAVVVAGRPVFVSVTEAVHLTGAGFVCVAGRFATEQPLRPAATEAVRRLMAALGVGDAIVHAEFKVGPRGWVLLETALRPGGAMVPEMTRRATGADLYRAQALLALDETGRVDEALRREPSAPHAQVRYLVAEGQVRRFVPPAVVLAQLPDVRGVYQQARPGQRVRVPLGDGGRAGYVTGWGTDRDQLDKQLSEALAILCRQMGVTMVDAAGDRHDVAA